MSEVLAHLRDLGIAYALVLPIGWDQEREARSAGLRTFPLVAVAACGFVLVGASVLGARSPAQARVLEGLITGIGFIGGGAILKGATQVRGTATAASIWTTGVIGAAVGYQLYDIAVVLAVLNFLTLRVLRPIKQGIAGQRDAVPPLTTQPWWD